MKTPNTPNPKRKEEKKKERWILIGHGTTIMDVEHFKKLMDAMMEAMDGHVKKDQPLMFNFEIRKDRFYKNIENLKRRAHGNRKIRN